jgi:hypothetical protein
MKTATTNKVLLIGNGINNLSPGYSWRNLIDDLIAFVGCTGTIRVDNKPFPLLYEEIFIQAAKRRNLREIEIKAFIADRVGRLAPNDIHHCVLAVGTDCILTTNYDSTLEMAAGAPARDLKNDGAIKEATYSLFRFVQLPGRRVWHIHGDCNVPQAITLGYEHYSGYLQKMRNYVVSGTGETYKNMEFQPLVRRLNDGTVRYDSWVDYFFTRDIYILGLTLDFVEIHLWWLLTYRARRKYREQKEVKNMIYYFYREAEKTGIQHRLDLLEALEVKPIAIKRPRGSWEAYYSNALDVIVRGCVPSSRAH